MVSNHGVSDMTSISELFTLTTQDDNLGGGLGNDSFTGVYSDGGVGGGNTFNIGDILYGGAGINTLNINPNLAIGAGAAATSLPDGLWAHITNIGNVDVTTNAGALTITSGPFFETAFAAAGVDLTATTGAGAMTIDMTAFTGADTINAMTSGAGAQTITAGSGPTTVTATAFAGPQTISGANLVTVVVTDDGAGSQTVTSTGAG